VDIESFGCADTLQIEEKTLANWRLSAKAVVGISKQISRDCRVLAQVAILPRWLRPST
jgi:hypothetical protein